MNMIFMKNHYYFIITLAILLLIGMYSNHIKLSEDCMEKIYVDVDINDDFEDDTIIAVVKKKYSEINKNQEKLFSKIEYKSIRDLTFANHYSLLRDTTEFEQILEITLLFHSKKKVIDTINEIAKINEIKYAGPSRYFKVDKTPNDPMFSSSNSYIGQWAHTIIESEKAWNFVTGYSGVRIGIIDSGIDNHPDLNTNITTGLDFVFNDNYSPGTLRNDPTGHGTHIAGIIGAAGNESTGIVGVNWNITMVPMQVEKNDGNISVPACVNAINYATDLWYTNNRISILNMSIGDSFECPELESAIRNYPGLFVCSTGNENKNNDLNGQHHYPSFYGSSLYSNPIPNMITVGRTDENDSRPLDDDANWGSQTINVYAPGQNIISTYPYNICINNDDLFYDNTILCEMDGSDIFMFNSMVSIGLHTWNEIFNNFDSIFGCTPFEFSSSNHYDDGYHFMTGSSMSTAYVSGVAGLLLSIDELLTAAKLKTAILNGADSITIQVPNDNTGILENQIVKRLNAFNAVKYILKNYSNTTYSLNNTSFNYSNEKSIVSGYSYFNNKNGFYRLNVSNARNYIFNITSNYSFVAKLYDSDFNEITYDATTITNGISINKYLMNGIYYLRVFFQGNQSGIITTQMFPTHQHSYNYTWMNYMRHNVSCACGDSYSEMHITNGIPISPGSPYSQCILCGGLVLVTINSPGSTNQNDSLYKDNFKTIPYIRNKLNIKGKKYMY